MNKELNWTTIKEAILIPDKKHNKHGSKTEQNEDNKIIEEETPRPTARKKMDDVTCNFTKLQSTKTRQYDVARNNTRYIFNSN